MCWGREGIVSSDLCFCVQLGYCIGNWVMQRYIVLVLHLFLPEILRFIYYSRPPYFGYKTPMFTFKWLFVVKFDQGSNSEYKGKWKEQNCPNNRDYKFFLTYQNQKWSSHFVHCFLMKVCNQDLKNICIEWENKIGVRKRKLFHQITKYNWFLCNMYFKLKKSPSLCQLAFNMLQYLDFITAFCLSLPKENMRWRIRN